MKKMSNYPRSLLNWKKWFPKKCAEMEREIALIEKEENDLKNNQIEAEKQEIEDEKIVDVSQNNNDQTLDILRVHLEGHYQLTSV